MADGWDAALNDEVELNQRLSQEADACRSSSASEEMSEDSESPVASWWAGLLFSAAARLGYQKPKWIQDPLRVVSGCTGCSAESAALKD